MNSKHSWVTSRNKSCVLQTTLSLGLSEGTERWKLSLPGNSPLPGTRPGEGDTASDRHRVTQGVTQGAQGSHPPLQGQPRTACGRRGLCLCHSFSPDSAGGRRRRGRLAPGGWAGTLWRSACADLPLSSHEHNSVQRCCGKYSK